MQLEAARRRVRGSCCLLMHFYGDMLGVWARTGLGVGAEVWKLSEFIQYFHLGSGSDNQVPTLIGLPSMNRHCMSANVSD